MTAHATHTSTIERPLMPFSTIEAAPRSNRVEHTHDTRDSHYTIKSRSWPLGAVETSGHWNAWHNVLRSYFDSPPVFKKYLVSACLRSSFKFQVSSCIVSAISENKYNKCNLANLQVQVLPPNGLVWKDFGLERFWFGNILIWLGLERV